MCTPRLTGCLFSLVFAIPTAAMAQDAPPLPPPPVYGAPVSPQPGPAVSPGTPVYAPAPTPMYAPAPTPMYAPPAYGAQPIYAQPPVYVRPPAPPPRPWVFRPQLGLGVRFLGAWSANAYSDVGQGGVAGDLMFRVHPRLTLDLSVAWLGTTDQSEFQTAYSRSDVPITLATRIHLGSPAWVASPYLVFATGGGWARAFTPVADQAGFLYEASDSGWFWDGQLGGGFELRLGRHFALNMDLRLTSRVRIDKQPRLEVLDFSGASVPILSHQFGGQLQLGLGAFF
ncbi:MAG: hypothetical protein JNJ46_02920 [Myxococcales bacterium]|nr:hypothetical protein [Myxococcales bacterium]